MAILQPPTGSSQQAYHHDLMHRVLAIDDSAPVKCVVAASNGKVGIGIDAPTEKLDVNGSINIPTGSFYKKNGSVLAAGDVGAVATNNAISGATKTKITYDSKGLVTSGADATASDVGAVAVNAAISGATKTKITYDAKGLITAGADATCDDIADGTNTHLCTTAQKTVIGNTSGTNSGNETASSIGTINHAVSAKTTLVDADELTGQDSASTYALMKVTCANVYNYIKSKTDLIYAPLLLTEVDVHAAISMTAAQASGTVLTNYGQTTADVQINLPNASVGLNFIFIAGTAQAGNYIKFQNSAAGDIIYLDGTAGTAGTSHGVEIKPVVGDIITFTAFKTGSSTYAWSAKSGKNAWTAY